MRSGALARVWQIVDVAEPGDRASRAFDLALIALILLNVTAFIAGTVPAVQAAYGDELEWLELASVIVFTFEYLARVISCTASPRFRGPFLGRALFVASPLALVDLMAVLPFYLPLLGADLRFLRLFRLLRLTRILKLGRYSESLRIIQQVTWRKRSDLAATLFVVLFLLVITSSVVYFVEGEAQPETFGSIPLCMWWSVATLTTVGYGDAYPITPLGKVVGAAVAILGIGLFALPTAILGAAFVDELGSRGRRFRESGSVCPHCGQERPSRPNE